MPPLGQQRAGYGYLHFPKLREKEGEMVHEKSRYQFSNTSLLAYSKYSDYKG